MPTPRVARARQLAAQLTGAGVAATADASELHANLPAVLIGPPRLAFDVGAGATATWRLLAVASTPVEVDAWDQLDALVSDLERLLPVEVAEPAAYAPPDHTALPAYALTYIETVES